VDFNRIKQEKVKKYIVDYDLKTRVGFKKLKPLCFMLNEAKYHQHVETFVIKQNISIVWNTYKTINHQDAWGGSMVSFGVQYSRRHNAFHYFDDEYSGMEVGQVIILNLRFIFGLLNIAVAHEISEMNEEEKMVKLCYMENGVTEGSQWISLSETKEGFTEVYHKTLYRSKSKFRDTNLYPRLHTKAITEFHHSVKKKAEQANQ
jgi:hypothetical protein